ncbi:hypothetical protein DFP72DRAFT_1073662 [Ephemerocybe angulata]|uniref:Uncharacterized protein n=1 Tax=Ephemerocybe angulata TaxID=980116 RepID=A0A8H6LZV9_9AGAR|nr:hypothetical protein DFP72DRAFT_1073662 [Tulosesus angulatus]
MLSPPNTLPPILPHFLKCYQQGPLPPVRRLMHMEAGSNTETLPPIRQQFPHPNFNTLPPLRQHFPDQHFSLPPLRQHSPDQPFPGPLSLQASRNVELNRSLGVAERRLEDMAREPAPLVQLQNDQGQPIASNGNGPRGIKRARDEEESEESITTTKKAR